MKAVDGLARAVSERGAVRKGRIVEDWRKYRAEAR